MQFDPDAYLASKAAPAASPMGFDPDAYLAAKAAPAPEPMEAPGYLETLARGAAQGGTLGFADELVGAGGAGVDALKKGTISDVVADYIASRDQYRHGDEAARAANPKTYLAGNITGGIATAAVPGLNIAALPTLGARAAGAGALGAVAGLGGSDADLTQGDVAGAAKDTLIGGATGAALQPVFEKVVAPLASSAKEKLGELAGSAGKKALNVAFDTPEEVTTRYLSDPDAVNGALSRENFGQKLADTLGELKNDTGPAYEQAMSTLSKDRLPVEGFEAEKWIAKLRSFGDQRANAIADRLEAGLKERAGQFPTPLPTEKLKGRELREAVDFNRYIDDQLRTSGALSEREAHDVKQALQGLGEWKSPLPAYEQSRANLASGDLNNLIKTQNDDYRQAMDAVSANIRAKQGLANKFGIVPDHTGQHESRMTFSDRTLSALNDLIRANKVDRRRILESLKEQGYGDLENDLRNTLAKGYFEGAGRTNGTRRVAAFAALGSALGHASGLPGGAMTGSALGAATGATVDKYAPQMAKHALDGTLLAKRLASHPTAKRFSAAVQQAAARGQGALATTHFILSQTQPDYQEAMTAER